MPPEVVVATFKEQFESKSVSNWGEYSITLFLLSIQITFVHPGPGIYETEILTAVSNTPSPYPCPESNILPVSDANSPQSSSSGAQPRPCPLLTSCLRGRRCR